MTGASHDSNGASPKPSQDEADEALDFGPDDEQAGDAVEMHKDDDDDYGEGETGASDGEPLELLSLLVSLSIVFGGLDGSPQDDRGEHEE